MFFNLPDLWQNKIVFHLFYVTYNYISGCMKPTSCKKNNNANLSKYQTPSIVIFTNIPSFDAISHLNIFILTIK